MLTAPLYDYFLLLWNIHACPLYIFLLECLSFLLTFKCFLYCHICYQFCFWVCCLPFNFVHSCFDKYKFYIVSCGIINLYSVVSDFIEMPGKASSSLILYNIYLYIFGTFIVFSFFLFFTYFLAVLSLTHLELTLIYGLRLESNLNFCQIIE